MGFIDNALLRAQQRQKAAGAKFNDGPDASPSPPGASPDKSLVATKPESKDGFFPNVTTKKVTPYSWEQPETEEQPDAKGPAKLTFISSDYHYPHGFEGQAATPENPEAAAETAPPPPRPETPEEKRDREAFEKAKANFDENEKKIAEGRERVGRKWRTISSALEGIGLKKKKFKDDEVKEYVAKRDELHKKIEITAGRAYKGNEEELFKALFQYDERLVAIRARKQEDELRVQNSKNWAGKALVGFANLGKNYREFIAKQFLNEKGKISAKGILKGTAISSAISITVIAALGAALPATAIAALGIGAGTAPAWALRVFGGVGAGYAAKKKMEKAFIQSTEDQVREDVLKKIEARKNKTDGEWRQFVEEKMGEGKTIGKEERAFINADTRHKRFALGIAGSTILAGWLASKFVAPHARGLFGQAWEKVASLWGGGVKPSVPAQILEAPPKSAPGWQEEFRKPTSAPKPSITPEQMETLKTQGAEQPPHQEYSSESRATEGRANFSDQPQTDRAGELPDQTKGFLAVSEPEAKAGRGIKEWPEKTPAAGAEVPAAEIPKPQFEEIASMKFKAGNTIEGQVRRAIEAKPSAFHLNPEDPEFAAKAGEMRKIIIKEFYERQGFKSYAEFDQYCRKNVWVGDEFKLIENPTTKEIQLQGRGHSFKDVFSTGKIPDAEASGAKVSQAVPTEVGTAKGAVPEAQPEPQKTVSKAGVVEEPRVRNVVQKAGGKVTGMEEIEADYQKDLADRKYARAVRAEQDLQSLHERQAAHLKNVNWEAHQRQVLATRGLLNRIIEGVGVGNNVSFWEGSALKWYDQITNMEEYIAQDVSHMEEVDKLNLNVGKLKELFLKLGRPNIGESNGKYLQRVMENSSNIELINQIISRE